MTTMPYILVVILTANITITLIRYACDLTDARTTAVITVISLTGIAANTYTIIENRLDKRS